MTMSHDDTDARERAIAALELRLARTERAATAREEEAKAARRHAQRMTEELDRATQRERELVRELTKFQQELENGGGAPDVAKSLRRALEDLEQQHQRA